MIAGADDQSLDVYRRALKPAGERADDVLTDQSHLDDLVAGLEKLAIRVFGPRGRPLARNRAVRQPENLR